MVSLNSCFSALADAGDFLKWLSIHPAEMSASYFFEKSQPKADLQGSTEHKPISINIDSDQSLAHAGHVR